MTDSFNFLPTALAATQEQREYGKHTLKSWVDWARTAPQSQIEWELRHMSERYYNRQQLVTDEVYDALRDALGARFPRSAVLTEVGAPVAEKMVKAKLPYPMSSLNKIKSENAQGWLDAHDDELEASEKLDGFSLMIDYTAHGVKLYTRGKGVIGGDISSLVPYLDLPRVMETATVRAEGIINKAGFSQFSSEFENERNFLSSVFNSQKINVAAAKAIRLVAYEISSQTRRLSPEQQKHKLKLWGFHTPWSKVYKSLDIPTLNRLLDERRAKSHYHIDGLVIRVNKPYTLAPDASKPTDAVAFKKNAEENIVEATVEYVEWRVSKDALLKPRVWIKPVRLQGVTVEKATGHNAGTIWSMGIGPGAVIRITRSGEVIPYIVEVVKAVEPSMPDSEYTWESDFEIKAVESDDNKKDIKLKQMVHFSNTLGIEGLKLGNLAKLYDAGITTIKDLILATKEDLLQAEGIQDKTADKLWTNLHDKVYSSDFASLGDALGVFGRLIGKTRLTALQDAVPDILNKASLPKDDLIALIDEVPGFSYDSAAKVAEQLPKFKAWLQELGISAGRKKAPKKSSDKLSGVGVLMTGFRDDELSAAIVANGGSVVNSVNQATVLLAADTSSESVKAKAAKEKGIPVMTPAAFRRKYGL